MDIREQELRRELTDFLRQNSDAILGDVYTVVESAEHNRRRNISVIKTGVEAYLKLILNTFDPEMPTTIDDLVKVVSMFSRAALEHEERLYEMIPTSRNMDILDNAIIRYIDDAFITKTLQMALENLGHASGHENMQAAKEDLRKRIGAYSASITYVNYHGFRFAQPVASRA